MKRKRVSPDWLRKIGVPGSLILGIVFASIYGVSNLDKLGPDFHRDSRVFTNAGVVREEMVNEGLAKVEAYKD